MILQDSFSFCIGQTDKLDGYGWYMYHYPYMFQIIDSNIKKFQQLHKSCGIDSGLPHFQFYSWATVKSSHQKLLSIQNQYCNSPKFCDIPIPAHS